MTDGQHSGFESWITNELQERGWSIRELARRGGVSHTAVNNALSDPTSLDIYKAIARGLDVPLLEVLQRAGELPEPPDPVPDEQAVIHLFRQVPPAFRAMTLRILATVADTPVDSTRDLRPGESIVIRQWTNPALLRAIEAMARMTPDQIDRLIDLVEALSHNGEGERRNEAAVGNAC